MDNLLKELSLSDYQIKIYKEFLKNGPSVAAVIGRKLNIDKATTYRNVEALEKMNLLIKTPKGRNSLYEAANPDVLNTLMKEKQIELEVKSKKLEELVAKLMKESKDSNSTYITVEKGFEAHYKMMQRQLACKEKLIRQKINTNASIYDAKDYIGWNDYISFMEDFVEKRVAKKIFMKQLIHADIQTKLHKVHKTSKELWKEVRILPTEIIPNISFHVFDDFFIITFHENDDKDLTIITIKDSLVAELIKTLFDFLFDRSIVYYGGKNKLPTKKFGSSIVPVLGIGTWGVGGNKKINPYNDQLGEVEQIKHSISLGQTYIDTCLSYAEGSSVQWLAKAIKNFPRKDLFINAKFTYNKDWSTPKSFKDIEKQCDKYLEIFNTEYLDSFMIHSPAHTYEIGMDKTLAAFDKLVEKGKIKNISVSNFSLPHLKKAIKLTKYGIKANEVHYNAIVRVAKDIGIIDFCYEHNILIIAYRPVRLGQFNNIEEDNLILELAQKYKRTPNQIALNWLVSLPNIIAIPKSTNGSHINENAAAVEFKMEKKDYESLNKWRDPSYVVPNNFDPDSKKQPGSVGWTSL